MKASRCLVVEPVVWAPDMASVLVVDDEFGITEVVDALLTDCGHQVRRAINGRQALDLVHEHIPDLIILDVMMPLMDGPTTLRALRSESRTQGVPVILMSALPPEKVAQLAGPDHQGLLQKPFTAEQLLDAIARALPPKAES